MKQRLIASPEELDQLEATITAAAASTTADLALELRGPNSLSVLAKLKFAQAGCDPLDVDRSLNLIEQLNQTFTYLASIGATRWLLLHEAGHAPFTLNLGTAAGWDISSTDGAVVAEVFAATHPDSNDKLRKDVEKVRTATAPSKYVFYLSPVTSRMARDDVAIIRLDHPSLTDAFTPDA